MGDKIDILVRKAFNLMKDEHYDVDKGWERVRCRTVKRRIFSRVVMRYVAGLVALVGVAVYCLWPREEVMSVLPSLALESSTRVELILANGERVMLDREKEVKVEALGVSLTRDSASGEVVYRHVASDTVSRAEATPEVRYNDLRVPKGADFSLKLPDGSVVHLNSESSLRFPVQFSDTVREVYLEGEVFFEVAKNEQAPFVVHAGKQSVTVLGTKFNVSAYAEDSLWQTTLVEGRVAVHVGEQERILAPSEQLTVDRSSGAMEVARVDTDLYTSWLAGKYHFKGYRFEDIMKKMERWYDFEIFYERAYFKDMKFRGTIDKYCSLEEMLRYIEETSDVIRFEIKDQVIIMKEK